MADEPIATFKEKVLITAVAPPPLLYFSLVTKCDDPVPNVISATVSIVFLVTVARLT